jgi:hypothetical protein
MPSSYRYEPGPDGKLHAVAVPVVGQLHTPEGRPTPVKLDAAGNRVVETEKQLSILMQVDPPDNRPTLEKAFQLATVQKQIAKLAGAPAPGDQLLADMQAMGTVDDAVTAVATDVQGNVIPPTQEQYDQRVSAAARIANSLGMQLVMVNDDPVLRVPPHLEVRAGGIPYLAGSLEAIESRLAIDARQRAARDRAVKLIEDQAAERARVQAEAVAASPAARLARLEAKLAAAGLAAD